jgi:hypothetical protein
LACLGHRFSACVTWGYYFDRLMFDVLGYWSDQGNKTGGLFWCHVKNSLFSGFLRDGTKPEQILLYNLVFLSCWSLLDILLTESCSWNLSIVSVPDWDFSFAGFVFSWHPYTCFCFLHKKKVIFLLTLFREGGGLQILEDLSGVWWDIELLISNLVWLVQYLWLWLFLDSRYACTSKYNRRGFTLWTLDSQKPKADTFGLLYSLLYIWRNCHPSLQSSLKTCMHQQSQNNPIHLSANIFQAQNQEETEKIRFLERCKERCREGVRMWSQIKKEDWNRLKEMISSSRKNALAVSLWIPSFVITTITVYLSLDTFARLVKGIGLLVVPWGMFL